MNRATHGSTTGWLPAYDRPPRSAPPQAKVIGSWIKHLADVRQQARAAGAAVMMSDDDRRRRPRRARRIARNVAALMLASLRAMAPARAAAGAKPPPWASLAHELLLELLALGGGFTPGAQSGASASGEGGGGGGGNAASVIASGGDLCGVDDVLVRRAAAHGLALLALKVGGVLRGEVYVRLVKVRRFVFSTPPFPKEDESATLDFFLV